MFRALKKFSNNHKIAKKVFKKAYINADIRSKKSFFTIWKKTIESDK